MAGYPPYQYGYVYAPVNYDYGHPPVYPAHPLHTNLPYCPSPLPAQERHDFSRHGAGMPPRAAPLDPPYHADILPHATGEQQWHHRLYESPRMGMARMSNPLETFQDINLAQRILLPRKIQEYNFRHLSRLQEPVLCHLNKRVRQPLQAKYIPSHRSARCSFALDF
jgi:hypothetical protein